jgi:hypothetical protein
MELLIPLGVVVLWIVVVVVWMILMEWVLRRLGVNT